MDRLDMVEKLFSAYPNSTPTAKTFATYLEILEEVPNNELHAVVMQCIREGGSFPPSAGQVFERWRNMRSAVSPDLAAQGWLSVQKALRDPATYSPTPEGPMPKFKDPLVGKAVQALGWFNLRVSENPRTDQAQFERLYKMFSEQEAGEQRLSPEFKQLRDTAQEREGFGGLRQIGTVLNGVHGGEN